MTMLTRVLILMIALAISIQNTCPQGWAAKTAFVTCHGSHCPMKEQKSSKDDEQGQTRKDMPIVKQTFVLNFVTPVNAFQLLEQPDRTFLAEFSDHKEIFTDPFFRPPISSRLS